MMQVTWIKGVVQQCCNNRATPEEVHLAVVWVATFGHNGSVECVYSVKRLCITLGTKRRERARERERDRERERVRLIS